ncbi:hypothetical protein [Variovorax sp. LjRoot290]|uniref:hypothetical protein n=1 Tax=Variovorax sp. LjRoot290 TaxID=3342316 RepID=UPI003F5106F5
MLCHQLSDPTLEQLVHGYATLASLVRPAKIAPTIKDDPDDDAVLAAAVAARARLIVSGDRHLLTLGQFQGIAILTVRQPWSNWRSSHSAHTMHRSPRAGSCSREYRRTPPGSR